MIVRIMGEGQLNVPADAVDQLNDLDDALASAVDSGDEQRFTGTLRALLDKVRVVGTPVPDDELTPSELVLPSADTGLAEVKQLLGREGLIPD